MVDEKVLAFQYVDDGRARRRIGTQDGAQRRSVLRRYFVPETVGFQPMLDLQIVVDGRLRVRASDVCAVSRHVLVRHHRAARPTIKEYFTAIADQKSSGGVEIAQ